MSHESSQLTTIGCGINSVDRQDHADGVAKHAMTSFIQLVIGCQVVVRPVRVVTQELAGVSHHTTPCHVYV